MRFFPKVIILLLGFYPDTFEDEHKQNRPHLRTKGGNVTKNYQEVTTPSDGRGSLAFAIDNDCRRYTTLLQKDHVSVIR